MYRGRVGLVILAPYNGDLFQQRQNGFIVLFPVLGFRGNGVVAGAGVSPSNFSVAANQRLFRG
jgi:hypothetical protein